MKNSFLALFLFIVVLNLNSRGDEGMWLPSLVGKLNIEKMNSIGCRLSAEDIYSINHSSLKDAVVALDHGSCTAELISSDGLLLTNHHCGFGEIQGHSSVQHDYLSDGFWALKREDELSNPGKTATFLISMDDVSEQVLKNVSSDLDSQTRSSRIREAIFKIEKQAKTSAGFDVRVKSLFESNKYYLFVSQTFRDIRLVGTPPQSIGKFGGESDNWMWPRHTGDFSMFRIYCSPDGKPAEYAKENVPYHPRHFLPVSLKGVQKNDFSMVLGYPGTTNRYLTAAEVKNTIDVVNQVRITAREAMLSIIRDYMATSQKARIQYASKYARSSNYYKYSIGQNKGLTNLDVIARKISFEKDFREWVSETAERKSRYSGALDSIAATFKNRDAKIAEEYMRETMLRGAEIFSFASKSASLYSALKGKDKAKITAAAESFRSALGEYFKDYDANTDKKIAGTLLKIYSEKVSPKYIPGFFQEIKSKYKGDFNEYAERLFSKTVFADQSKLESFLNKPSAKVLDKDPAFIAMRSIFETEYFILHDLNKTRANLDSARRVFVSGLIEKNKDYPFYPDANSTMRLTYGVVDGYTPHDAAYYDYFTTLKGYTEKGIRGDVDFDFPQRLVDLYHAKDYGQYGDKDGTLHTCFTSNNDITGGNSGSPVINGSGELIGIAFDGNWEAMSGDITYEPDLQKCICVDIRFVLWTIDKFAGAGHLINEMKLVR